MPWAILDGKRPYIPRTWETEAEARFEMAGLLRHYPPNHEWRRRLSVQEWNRAVPRKDEKVPNEDEGLSEGRSSLRSTS